MYDVTRVGTVHNATEACEARWHPHCDVHALVMISAVDAVFEAYCHLTSSALLAVVLL
jgi:hypothetical protein